MFSLTRTRDTGPLARLWEHGSRRALVGDGVTLTYADLAERVADVADRLGSTRRLVLVEAGNTVDAVVAYLAALAGRHPVLLAGPGASAALVASYQPDVVIAEQRLTELRPGTIHDLHPDLAVLLSTSGSTGSPKLVRLSADNLVANAAAIADYLDLTSDDLAATSLPMHYCYGLSVVNSHLFAGAGLLLTDRSVVEQEFWRAFREHGATSFAGVPYTFELLDRIGFPEQVGSLPSLRCVTQAGGRLPADDVRRYARLGREHGFDLFVMYGQTEATARMAYLPPALAESAAGAIGVPVPGGAFTLAPLPERPAELAGGDHDGLEVGELVYHGPNVMLGYAESPADLALGRIVHELRTGDVARLRADGLYEVIGRRSRFAKVFGLRIDLDHAERVLAARGVVAAAADGGSRLVLGICSGARPVDRDRVLAIIRDSLGVPATGVALVVVPDLPRLPSGKTDYRALVELAAREASDGREGRRHRGVAEAAPTAPTIPAEDNRTRAVLDLYRELLGRPEVSPADSFVGLGGDSLSYVELSLRLERILGDLPPDWHSRPIAALVDRPRAPQRRGRLLETNVLLRAIAIVTIVGTHANLWTLLGGAHVLIGVIGFNLARFQLTDAPRATRIRAVLRSAARVAVPAALVIAVVTTYKDGLGLAQVLLVNSLTSSRWVEPAWHYWFIEAYVQLLLVVALLLAVPFLDRLERRRPFLLPVGLALVALGFRYDLLGIPGSQDIHRAHACLFIFALGWAAARAGSHRQRLLVSALVVATVPGFVSYPPRFTYIVLGMLLLVWVPHVRVPSYLARAAAVLASASLWIYLVHWEFYPLLEDRFPLAATLLGLAAGILAHLVASSPRWRKLGAEVARVPRRGGASSAPRWDFPGARRGHRELIRD